MTAAVRKTPTNTNGGSDNGVNYTNAVDAEVENLWKLVPEWLVSIAGTANAITASTDTSIVAANSAIARPKRFYLVPTANNTAAVTLNIDGLGAKAVVDKDGNALAANTLISGRLYELVFDGTSFRIANSVGGSGTPASIYGVNNGRLSLSSGVFVPTSGITAATTLYWTPAALGNQIALYSSASSSWIAVASSEKSVGLTVSQNGNTHNGTRVIDGLTDTSQFIPGMKVSGTGVGVGAVISTIDSATQVTVSVNSTATATVSVTFKLPLSSVFDVFGFLDTGNVLKLELAPWTNTTTRATALTTQDGVLVKSGTLSGTGATVGAGTRRYLGTIATTATDGQSEFSFGGVAAGGSPASLLVFNYANRRRFAATVKDSTDSWTYNVNATWRPANSSNNNRITYVCGIAEDSVEARYSAFVAPTMSGNVVQARPFIGIGIDVTNANSALPGTGVNYADPGNSNAGMITRAVASYDGLPSGVGLHFLQAVETPDANLNATFYGDNGNATFYQGGLVAQVWL